MGAQLRLGILDLVHPTYGPPQLRRSAVAIDTLHYTPAYIVGADHVSHCQHALGVSLIM